MIPITYRLNDADREEYKKIVTKHMKKKNREEVEINLKNILSNICYVSNKNLLDQILVMSFSEISEIKRFLDDAYIQFKLNKLEPFKASKGIEYKTENYKQLSEFEKSETFKNMSLTRGNFIEKFLDEFYYPFVYLGNYYKNHFSNKNINKWIIDKTKVNVCPYCNILYTYNRGNSTTAQLDHFFPKAIYPLLSLSFYNLVPVCPSCNRIKSDNTDEIGSPYEDNAFSSMKISWKPIDNVYRNDISKTGLDRLEDNIEIIISSKNNKEKRGLDIMRIQDAYKKHVDYASELIKKVELYGNPDMQKLIINSCKDMKINDKDIERFYFSNYIDNNDLHKRSLAKMTHDFLYEYNEHLSW